MSRRAVLACAATLVAALALSTSAFARAIDPAGTSIGNGARLSSNRTTVGLGGVVACAGCRTFTLGATVSQRTSGAVAQGGVRCVCRGARERWSLSARTREGTKFRQGAARVCVWIIARGAASRAIDADQWCEDVTLRFSDA
jgi:hypothetical protein